MLSTIKGRTTRLQRELIGYVQEQFDEAADPCTRSYKAKIGETTYICESQKYGKTMFQVYPDHKVTEQYRELVRELEARLDAIEGFEREQPIAPHTQGEVVHG